MVRPLSRWKIASSHQLWCRNSKAAGMPSGSSSRKRSSRSASALRFGGRPEAAVPHYERAIALDPSFSDAHYNLAGLFESLGRARYAIRHYHEVIAAERRLSARQPASALDDGRGRRQLSLFGRQQPRPPTPL
jgi:tetratricopeptide (TPR) repeat protein